MGYEPITTTASYEVGRRDGLLIAACICGAGESGPDKGLVRAKIAAWQTRHRDCAGAARGAQA